MDVYRDGDGNIWVEEDDRFYAAEKGHPRCVTSGYIKRHHGSLVRTVLESETDHYRELWLDAEEYTDHLEEELARVTRERDGELSRVAIMDNTGMTYDCGDWAWEFVANYGDPTDPSVWDYEFPSYGPHKVVELSDKEVMSDDTRESAESIADLEAMVDRLHERCEKLYNSRAWEEKKKLRDLYLSQCEQTARANETIGTLRAENERLEAERGPVVAYEDCDARVWVELEGDDDKWTSCDMGIRTLNQIARKFGPLVALHEGEPLEWDGEGEGDE